MNKLYYTEESYCEEHGEASTIRVYQIQNGEPFKIIEVERDEDYSIKEQIDSELEDIATEETFKYIRL